MAASTIPKNKRNGTLTISDFGDANSLEISYEAGDFSFTTPKAGVISTLDRGEFTSPYPSLSKGDDQPVSFTFSAFLRDVTSATDEVLLDIANFQNYILANWTPVNGASANVPLFKLAWKVEYTGESTRTTTFAFCDFVASVAEGDQTVISIAGIDYEVQATVA